MADAPFRDGDLLAGYSVPSGTKTAFIQKVSLVGESGSSQDTPLGYQQIANTTLAASSALTAPNGAKKAVIQNNGSQPARWRDDGQAPTASTGLRLPPGDELVYEGSLSAIRLIREADGVTIDVAYYA